MEYDIIAAHIIFKEGGKNEVTVAIRSNPNYPEWWRAYRSNDKQMAGYPVHCTDDISSNMLQSVAATGLKVEKAEAVRMFPQFNADVYGY